MKITSQPYCSFTKKRRLHMQKLLMKAKNYFNWKLPLSGDILMKALMIQRAAYKKLLMKATNYFNWKLPFLGGQTHEGFDDTKSCIQFPSTL